jgi:hypothetical protein
MDRLGQLSPLLLLLGENSASNAASICPDALCRVRASPAFLFTHMREMPNVSQRVTVRACNTAAADGPCTSTRLVLTGVCPIGQGTGVLQQLRQIAY